MATDTPVTPTATSAAPAPQPDEGLLHELATSAGLDPEAIVATAKAIRQHPWQVAKEVGSAQAGEFVDAGHHLRDTALSALNGVASAITNPEAKATAIARLKSPGLINKIQGAEEYATAAVPLVGGNYVKAEEQAGRGNIAGSIGTTLGTTLPLVTDTEGAEGIKAHLAETGKTFVDSAKEGLQRAAVAATAPEGSAEAGFAKISGKKVAGNPAVAKIERLYKNADESRPHKVLAPGKVEPEDIDEGSGGRGVITRTGHTVVEPVEAHNEMHPDIINNQDNVRIANHDSFQLDRPPSTQQRGEIARLAKGGKMFWDLSDKGLNPTTGQGSVGDFQRALDSFYGPSGEWTTPDPEQFASVGGKLVGNTPEPPAPPATAPEGSAEAGFAKIPGSKKVRGAQPKPTEPVSIVPKEKQGSEKELFKNGGWALPNGENYIHDYTDGRKESHGVSAKVMGFAPHSGSDAEISALQRGGIRVTTDNSDVTTVAASGITDTNKSRLLDVLAAAPPNKPVFLAYAAHTTEEFRNIHPPQEFSNPEEAIDWVDRQTPQSAQPDKLAAVPGAKFVGKAPSPAEPVSAPAETAADVEKPYQAVEKTPETAASVEKPYHPDLQKVIDLPGVKVHTDPKQVTEAAHFVTPDGKFVRLPAGLDHDAAINTAKPDQTEYDPRINFINDTGAVRIRPTADKGGQNLAVQVPTQGITPEQVDTLKQAVGQGMKSRGNLTLETAAIPTDQKSEYKDVANPRDIEPMLRKIGAHPDPEPLAAATPSIYTKEGAQGLADHVGAKVVGSVAEKGISTHDLDLKVDEYDQPKIEAAMKAKGFEPVGSSILSPKEIKASGKSFGTAPTEWARAYHFESVSEPRQKVDIWHTEPAKTPQKGQPIRAYHGTAATTNFNEFSTEGRPVDEKTGEPLTSGSGPDPTSYFGAHFAAEPETANKFAARSIPWMRSRYEAGEGAEGAAGPRVIPVDLKFKKVMNFGPENKMRDMLYSGDLTKAGYAGDALIDKAMRADGIEDPENGGPEAEKWVTKYNSDLQFRQKQNRWLFEEAPQDEEDDLSREGAAELATQARQQLLDAGYDGASYDNEVEGGKSYVAFHPNTITSPFKAPLPKIAYGNADEFASAVQNTTGAKLNGKELTVRAERYQKPEQAGSPSIRTGVFYSPEPNSPYSKYYKTGKIGYGGTQRIEGDITFKNPIVAKGASGGKVPERVYDSIQGKGAYDKMRTDVLNAVMYTQDYRSKLPEKLEQNVANVLAKYGADPDNSAYIIEHSKTGNTLPYAIQENIVAHALRAAGHDGIVGYNKIKGQHRLSEIFHITQDTYPEGE